jgi:predicted aldo/keto reductase-like oxidoreductase
MRYSEYGRTGKQVSAVGFGGMRFNMELSHEENSKLVEYAFSQGINYFDNAPAYCDGQGENIFGLAFKQMQRDKFFVSTKLMPEHTGSRAETRTKVLQSIEKMNCGHIDFFHVWCLRRMTQFDEAMKSGGLYEELLQCQADGLIRHIVFSSHQTGNDIRKIIASGKFDGVLMGINILNFPYRQDGVDAAKEYGVGVVAMNPLAGGLIPQSEKNLGFISVDGLSPTETALRFLIANPDINITLNGFTTREHVDTACRIADMEPIQPAELERIKAGLPESMNHACTGCGYCNSCPQKIPVPSYMQFFNRYKLFGMSTEEMVGQIAFQHNWGLLADRKADAGDCTGCGRCEFACTQHLDIINRMKIIAGWEEQHSQKK